MPPPRSLLLRNIGAAVAARRHALGLTQAEVGARLGATPQWVSQLERGQGSPSIAMLSALATVLQTTLSRLFGQAEGELETAGPSAELDVIAAQLDPADLRVLVASARALLAERERGGS